MTEVELIFQTTKGDAACFHEEEAQAGPLFGGKKPRDIWLPLSEITISGAGRPRRGSVVKVTLPEWLAIKEGLV